MRKTRHQTKTASKQILVVNEHEPADSTNELRIAINKKVFTPNGKGSSSESICGNDETTAPTAADELNVPTQAPWKKIGQ